MSSFINLHIVVPEVHIEGQSELHVDMGSIINLLCIIEKVSDSSFTNAITFVINKKRHSLSFVTQSTTKIALKCN